MKQDQIIELSPELISDLRRFFARYSDIIAFALIAIVGTAAYIKSFYADFQFDDYASIVDNSLMKRLDFSVLWGNYRERFLTNLTFVLKYLSSGLNVFGWHFVNNLIHIVASFVVYLLTRTTLQTPRLNNQWDTQAQFVVALSTALMFLVHPLQTQAVTYIVQRATSLSGLFYLATVYFYAQGRLHNRRREYFLAAMMCMLGIFTKPTVITLPLTIILYDVVFFKVDPKAKFEKLLSWIFFTFAVALIPLALVGKNLLTQEAFEGFQQTSMGHYALTQLNVVASYLRLFIFPFGQNLDYDFPIAENILQFPTSLSLVLLLGLVYLALRFMKNQRYITFGIFWFFITLGPQSSIFALRDVIVEHRVYLAYYGLCLIACIILYRTIKSFRIYLGLMVLLIGTLAVMTYQRNALWSDATRFMEDVVVKSPQKARPHNNLGFFYFREGRLMEAESEYKKAIQSDPGYTIAYHNLATVYFESGQIQKARRIFEQLVEQFPGYADPHVGLANILLDLGDIAKAKEFYQKAVKANPFSSAAYVGLGNCSQKEGDLVSAVSSFQKAIWLNPDSASAYYNLGNVYYRQSQLYPALTSYQKAVKLRPEFANAYNNLGNIYFHFYDYDKALEQFRLAIRLDPNLAEGYLNLANTLHEVGYIATARAYAQVALQLYQNQGQAVIAQKIEKQLFSKK